MKRVLLCWLLAGTLASAQEAVVIDGPIRSEATGNGAYDLEISTRVTRPLAGPASVPIPVSYLRMVAPLRVPQISEDNILESGYEVDLNGNRVLDEVSIGRRDGELRLDMMPVEPLGAEPWGEQQPYREDGSPKRYFLDPDCPEFMVLFYQPPLFGLELQHRGHRPEIVEMPSPCLQVLVYEPCLGPGGPDDLPGEPNFQLTFPGNPPQLNLMFAWQPPQWLRVQWFCLPLSPQPGQQSSRFHLDCNNDSNPVAIFAQVNYAPAAGVRHQGKPVIQTIYSGWKTPTN
ncbi:MAG: hypothetical protein KF760_28595 [Candidatus Eremiobacteraeota bacterium]|nr:hypothetical protein [Candidatus Eremiobacteraeota bacterium]MCW5865855.1 hypothetical protein [Candidatus Eremiobacteraeota bacterium]